MAITPTDFEKIWSSNATTPAYTFNDADYLEGWDFVGNLPPTRAQWNAIQKRTDEKMKYVFDNFGAPLVAPTVADMTDQNRVYVYTGSEVGYTTGDWYYYDEGTSSWVDGGVYNAVAFNTDTTLTVSGEAADAKVTGDYVKNSVYCLPITQNELESGTWEGNAKVSSGRRIRIKKRITVTKGTVILCDPKSLFVSFAIYTDTSSTTALESTVFLGKHTFIYEVQHDGVMIMNIANGATYATSTSIAVADYNMTLEVWQNSMPIKDLLKNRVATRYNVSNIAIIGDSISTFDGFVPDGYATFYPNTAVRQVGETWWENLCRIAGLTITTNASYSGSRVTNTHPNSYPDFYDRCSSVLLGSPELIFVELGTGDSSASVSLGDYDYDTIYTSLSEATFRTAYIKGIKALQDLYPTAKIVCVVCKMTDAYAESIYNIAKTLGVQVIDVRGYSTTDGTHPDVAGMREILYKVLNPTDVTLTQKDVPADALAVWKAFDNVASQFDNIAGFNEIFPDFSVIRVSINDSTGKIATNNPCRTVYFACEPNTIYRVTKTAGSRFVVGCTTTKPANGVTSTKFTVDQTASSIDFTTDSSAKWLAAMVYFETGDSPITAQEMLNSVHFYQYSAKTISVAGGVSYNLYNNNRSIYDTKNYAFWENPTKATGCTCQSVLYKEPNTYVFSSEPSLILEIAENGAKTEKTVSQFDHFASAQLLADGKFLVSSAEDYGLETEKRGVYIYDFDTNTITDYFYPTLPGKLVFAWQVDADNYYLIDWQGSRSHLHFYTYVRSTDTATEIGTMNIERTLAQGGCVVNNLLYLSINDGWNSQTDALIKVIDLTDISVVNTITMKGFVEVEGFHVVPDGYGNVFSYFADGKIYTVFKMRLV